MFLTVHIPAGLLIQKYVKNTFVIFILAIISHFILDIFPHDPNYSEKKIFIIAMIVDLFLSAILLSILLFYKKIKINKNITIAVFGAILPDIILLAPYVFFPQIKIFSIFFDISSYFHTILFGRFIFLPFFEWFPLQFLTFIILIYMLLKKKK
jgi:hypothetical protein